MEEKPVSPANGSRDETSGPTPAMSAERDEEKADVLDAGLHSSPEVRDDGAGSGVKGVAAAPEAPAKRKGKTALIMLAICVCRVLSTTCILRI
jgi:hypothetical protein